jgi:hypothetical protein
VSKQCFSRESRDLEENIMSPKYEKPQLIPFSSDRYEIAQGKSCGSGTSAAPDCASGGSANVNCNPGSTANACALGSAG